VPETARKSPAERSIADALRSCAVPLGCPVGYLESPRVSRHRRPGNDHGDILTFSRGEVGVVSLPSAEHLECSLDDAAIDELLEVTRRDVPVGATVEVCGAAFTIGGDPVTLTMADNRTLQVSVPPRAALVYDPRAAVLDDLRSEVTPFEWHAGGGDLEGVRRVGALAGGALVALATVEQPMGRLARMRVIVSPSSRRRGFGRVVLDQLARRVLGEGFLPYGRLAAGDPAAHALATGVGFVDFARSLTLRAVAGRDYPAVTSINP